MKFSGESLQTITGVSGRKVQSCFLAIPWQRVSQQPLSPPRLNSRVSALEAFPFR